MKFIVIERFHVNDQIPLRKSRNEFCFNLPIVKEWFKMKMDGDNFTREVWAIELHTDIDGHELISYGFPSYIDNPMHICIHKEVFDEYKKEICESVGDRWSWEEGATY